MKQIRVIRRRDTIVQTLPEESILDKETKGYKPNYRELLEGLYDAVLISDLDGYILECNRRARKFLHYTRAEVCQLNIFDIMPSFNEDLYQMVTDHVANGNFSVIDVFCKRKDGSQFLSETAISLIRLREGGENLVFSIRNITARKQAEAMLRTEHNALQNSASCIAITDLSASLQYVNPSFLRTWGFEDSKDVIGMNIQDFWVDEKKALKLIEMPLRKKNWIGELEAITKKGRTFYLQVTAAPNLDTNDRLVGMVYSFIDITEHKKAQEVIHREAKAQMEMARRQEDFSGYLNILSISDVIQLIYSTSKSGELLLMHSDAEVGLVYFDGGRIVYAVHEDTTGEDAVCALICCEATSFRFNQKTPDKTDDTIVRDTMALLVDGNRLKDEMVD